MRWLDGITDSVDVSFEQTPKDSRASLIAQLVKKPPAIQVTLIRFLGQEDPLEKKMASHSSSLAWERPWIDKHGRL